MPDDARVPLGGRREIFVAIVNQTHRTPRLASQERRVNRDDRGILFLAPESAPGLGLDHDRLFVAERQRSLQRAMHVVGTLQRPDDLDPAPGLRDRDGTLRLDVELLLEADLERSLNYLDILQTIENFVNLALTDLDRAVGLSGPIDIKDRLQRLVLDGDRTLGGGQGLAVRSGNEEDRLLAVADLLGRERRLIVADQLNDVVARDVAGAHDRDLCKIEAGIVGDRADAPPGDARADRLAVPRAVDDEIVSVARAPRDLVASFAPRNGASNRRTRVTHATKCVPAIPAPLHGDAARALLFVVADIGGGGWTHGSLRRQRLRP